MKQVSLHNGRLNEIKSSDITLWQTKLITELNISPKRVKTIRSILNMLYEDAQRDEIVEKNPVALASNLPRGSIPKIYPFTTDEINKILSTAEGQFRNFYAIGFFTGMRTGEIIGLRWEDVDFKKHIIRVKRTIGRGMVSTPKTEQSIRDVEILDVLIPYLKEQQRFTGLDSSYLFMTKNKSHFFDIKNIRDHDWKKNPQKSRYRVSNYLSNETYICLYDDCK